MPEFELDLTNVESEVVDGVTVVKAAEVTAVSVVGLSAEDAAANLHANAAAIGRAFPAPIPGLNWAFKAAADAETERVYRAREETLTEHAIGMSGGSMQVRPDGIEDVYPLAQWIPDHQRHGGKVYRRRIIVVEDWTEVPRG